MRVLLCLLVVATSVMGAPDAAVFDQKPKKTRKFNAIQYFAQNGRTVSFGGDGLKWTGEGDCSQNEGMEPILSVQGEGVTIRNAFMIETPDGIHVSGKNVVIENVIFPKVCEDAITANGADNLIIRNCAFRGAKDKVIQLNGGTNILIENCYFENCSKPVRVKPGVTVTVRNNVSRDTTAFVMADGKGAKAVVENNDVKKSEWFVKAQKGAAIEVGANRTSRIEKANASEDGGTVTVR
ncbi:MAG: pectate lyase [Chthoniobacterales bacterium]